MTAHLSPHSAGLYHLRLAVELEASGRYDPETLAVHFSRGGDSTSAARYAERAADLAAGTLQKLYARQETGNHSLLAPGERTDEHQLGLTPGFADK